MRGEPSAGAAPVGAVVCALAAIGCTSDRAPAREAAPAHEPLGARVEAVRGDVRVQRDRGGPWLPLAAGAAIPPGAMVQALDGDARLHTPSGASLDVAAHTAIRLGGGADAPLAIDAGHLASRLPAASTRPFAFDVGFGTLAVQNAGPGSGEATIDVGGQGTTVELADATAELDHTDGRVTRIAPDQWVRFTRQGDPEDRGAMGPRVELLAPASDAALVTAGDITLSWQPQADATGYVVVLAGERFTRRTEATESSLTLTVASGRYRWWVHAMTPAGLRPASEARELTAVVDDRPPRIAVTEPADGAAVASARVVVHGRTEPGTVLRALGGTATADADGRFRLPIQVGRGLTRFVIRARDAVGNEAQVARTVVRP